MNIADSRLFMMVTKLLYLEDFNTLHATARVLKQLTENDKTVIVLDQTIFYPQGGGQPYDTGIIHNKSAKFFVEQTRFIDGIVKHIGIFEFGSFTTNDVVELEVNRERRTLHSRLHSAGHVIDMAIAELKLPWKPGKGFHFPEGPYIEYEGPFDDSMREKLDNTLEETVNKYVQEDSVTKLLFIDKDAMNKICRFVPNNLPENKPSRVVMYGDFAVPCGGTHVSHLAVIGHITIRKIRLEKGSIRVSYALAS